MQPARLSHRQVLALALPMLLSNITVPLLGLVDTWVIGHLGDAALLGGVAVGATLINLVLWLCGFLRMSTTGLTAQALGAADEREGAQLLGRGLVMALLLALLLLLGRPWLVEWAFAASDASGAVKEVARSYFTIRLWGGPAALCNLVILGWLLGRQDARAPMLILIASNSLNIVLDIWLVRGVGWGVQGAALASLLADYASLLLGGYCVTRHRSITVLRTQWHDLLRSAKPYRHMLALNRDIFIRSLCLQACFVFMTFQGAKLGDVVVAANAVLLNFLMLLSYGLDGFAYAAEAMVGRAVGTRRRDQLARAIRLNLQWALLTALLATLAFVWGGELLIRAMTSIDAVVAEALRQLPWLMALPLLSVWAYLFDGIFIGATRAREMRDSMLLAVLVGYFPVWWLAGGDNRALWAAMLVLMVGRGVGLGVWLYRLWHSHALVD